MRAECAAASARYRLVLPRRSLSGRLGERTGRGTGSSLEFMDYRDYAPGDDLRHVDWRTYARTDHVMVRLFREEISPHLEIIADTSASMAVTGAKATAARDLLDAAANWARQLGGHPRWLAGGGGPVADTEHLAFAGNPGELLPRTPLRPRSLRLLLSDFLFPGDPGPQIRRLASGAAHVYVVQLLDPWELSPTTEGPTTLVDCESGTRLDLELGSRAAQRYVMRLQRLRETVARAARGAGGSYACVAAAAPAAMFRDQLLPQGLVEPAA